MTVTWERSDRIGGDRTQFLVWAEGGDFEAFEAALADDPTVTPPRQTMNFVSRRLYVLELTEEGRQTCIYPLMVDEGGLVREMTATSDGWRLRVALPDRRALTHLHRFCRESGIDFDLRRLYVRADETGVSAYGLSPKQRDLLLQAFEAGYFEVPRKITLSELADEFGVSNQALSERLRRGVRTLIAQTLANTVETSRGE